MAYSIVYGMDHEQKNSKSSCRRFLLTVAMLFVFLWSVTSFWPDGREMLKLLLIPGDAETTIQAAEVFSQELSSGFSLLDAGKNFCNSVLTHGYSG